MVGGRGGGGGGKAKQSAVKSEGGRDVGVVKYCLSLWAVVRRCRCGIIWFSSSCVRPPWPCVPPLLRVSCGPGGRGAGCGGGVCTGAIAGLRRQIGDHTSEIHTRRFSSLLTNIWQGYGKLSRII